MNAEFEKQRLEKMLSELILMKWPKVNPKNDSLRSIHTELILLENEVYCFGKAVLDNMVIDWKRVYIDYDLDDAIKSIKTNDDDDKIILMFCKEIKNKINDIVNEILQFKIKADSEK